MRQIRLALITMFVCVGGFVCAGCNRQAGSNQRPYCEVKTLEGVGDALLPIEARVAAYDGLLQEMPSPLLEGAVVAIDEPDLEQQHLRQAVNAPPNTVFVSFDEGLKIDADRSDKRTVVFLSVNVLDHGGRYRYVAGKWSIGKFGDSVLMCLGPKSETAWEVLQLASMPRDW